MKVTKTRFIVSISIMMIIFCVMFISHLKNQRAIIKYILRINTNIEAINTNIRAVDTNIRAVDTNIRAVDTNIRAVDTNIEAILNILIAEKAEQITKNKTTTEGKVIALAEWVSSNIANNKESDNNIYLWFSKRNGSCGVRAQLFVKMLHYINVIAVGYNICKFPTCELGHSCAQVYYDNAWHFFDVTYAGYFKVKEKILSFEEIIEISKKEDVLKYLIVFDKTLDYYADLNSFSSLHLLLKDEMIKATRVDNQDRMRKAYAREILLETTEYGSEPDKIRCDCCKKN